LDVTRQLDRAFLPTRNAGERRVEADVVLGIARSPAWVADGARALAVHEDSEALVHDRNAEEQQCLLLQNLDGGNHLSRTIHNMNWYCQHLFSDVNWY
jgi:hypothetical protein